MTWIPVGRRGAKNDFKTNLFYLKNLGKYHFFEATGKTAGFRAKRFKLRVKLTNRNDWNFQVLCNPPKGVATSSPNSQAKLHQGHGKTPQKK